MFIKIGVAEIPPLTFVFGRVGLASVILYVALRWKGQNLPRWGIIWKHIAVVAFFHNAAPYVLFSWGEQFIDSGLASILNGITPIFTIVLTHFWVEDDRLTPAKLLGVSIGFGGLLVLIAPTIMNGVQATTNGIIAIIIATLCYAIAFVYARNHLRGLPPLVAPTSQLVVATIFMMPLALLIDQPFNLPVPSWPVLAAWLTISVLGTALAFLVYYRLVEMANPSFLAMYNYLLPIMGIGLGVLVLGEQLTWNAAIGFAIILVAVMTMNGVWPKQKNRIIRRTS